MGSTETSKGDLLIATDVIVIGAGFSGLYALHKVRQLGLSVKVIDAGSDFGGTWHWNRYPGARVDTEAPLYALSIPELWKNWTWSERFPAHDELRRYFQFAGATLDAYKDTHFKTIVDGAVYRNNQWNLKIRGGGAATCTYLILSTGSSYKTHFPQFMDLDKYQGQLIHSALYPEAGIDVKGKRVAVIGSGASGIQVVQELAKQDCDLTQYVRTPNIALPMANRQFSAGEQETGKNFYEMLYRNVRNHQSGFPYNAPKGSFGELTKDERNAQLEYLWDRSGFVFLTGNHRDYLLDRETNKFFYDFWLEKTRARIRDDEKREILAPVEQAVLFGTKRHSLEQDYYECIDQDNVTIIDLKKSPLSHFTQHGIATEDGIEREYDLVILATGYDSLTGSLVDLNIEDTQGRSLSTKWKQATYTYLGLMIDGMPNAFLTYSPQAPTSLANGPAIIEVQVDWIVDAISKMREEGIQQIEPLFEASEKWRATVQAISDKTLFSQTDSWYMGANIPGKPREMLIYLGGMDVYEQEIRKTLVGWDGFRVTKLEHATDQGPEEKTEALDLKQGLR